MITCAIICLAGTLLVQNPSYNMLGEENSFVYYDEFVNFGENAAQGAINNAKDIMDIVDETAMMANTSIEHVRDIVELTGRPIYTDEDLFLVAQMVEAEAGNQDLNGRRYVADVIFNRTESGYWPGNVHDVLFQKGQFQSVRNGRFASVENKVSDLSFTAVKLEAMPITRLDRGIVYFGRKKKNGNGHWKYGAHYFSY